MMEDFDQGVEPEAPERGSRAPMMAVWVAVVGVVVGETGIILANRAQGQVRALEERLAGAPDRTAELAQAIESMEERLVRLGSEFVRLSRADTQLQEATQVVARDVRANREAINQVAGRMTELVERMESWRPVARAAPAAEPSGEAAVAEGGVHVIQSGDTLSKIANQYGIPLSRLQQANPDVNPRALRIGQRIVIPQP